MKKTKNKIVDEAFEGKPTRFGKAVVEAANHNGDWNYMKKMFEIFLNIGFWIPVSIKNKGTKKESISPVLSVHKNGSKNLILFEKKARAISWHKNNKQKLDEIFVAEYKNGHDFLKSFSLPLLKQYDLYIDFGKKTLFVLEPEQTLWLRKEARKIN